MYRPFLFCERVFVYIIIANTRFVNTFFSNCIIMDLPIVVNTCPLSRTAYLYGLSNRSVICSSSPCAIFSNVSNRGLAPSQMSPIVDFGTPHNSAAFLIVKPLCSKISFILIFIIYAPPIFSIVCAFLLN